MRDRSLFVQKFEQIANQDPRVLTAFLGGSLADGTEDEFSDVDIYYVIDEQYYSQFMSEIRAKIEDMGELVFYDQHNNFGFDLILFIYRNGVKGELGLGTIKNLKTLHAGPFKVLVDKNSILKGFVFPYEPPLRGEALRIYLEKQLGYYWYWYFVFLSAAARGRLWSAFSQLQQMRDCAFKLIVLAYQPERIPGQRFERTVPQNLRDQLGRTILAQYTRQSMLASAEGLTRILKREIQGLLSSTGANYPSDLEATVLERKESSQN